MRMTGIGTCSIGSPPHALQAYLGIFPKLLPLHHCPSTSPCRTLGDSMWLYVDSLVVMSLTYPPVVCIARYSGRFIVVVLQKRNFDLYTTLVLSSARIKSVEI